MSLILRTVKNSPLTFQEGDDNFLYLEGLNTDLSSSFLPLSESVAGMSDSITDLSSSILPISESLFEVSSSFLPVSESLFEVSSSFLPVSESLVDVSASVADIIDGNTSLSSSYPIGFTGSTIFSNLMASSGIPEVNGVLLGNAAGVDANNAYFSNFIGYSAGASASNAAFSNLIGYKAGYNESGSGIGTNNIVIGTNITLDENKNDAINIGGIIFGSGSYSDTIDAAYSGSANGKIGINVVDPIATLDVSGSGHFTEDMTVDGTLTAGNFVGTNMTLSGTLTANALAVVTSSIDFVTGSTQFGSIIENTHNFTGSVSISGSFSAPLQLGYAWVGNSAGRSVAVPTSSFSTGGGGSVSTSGTTLYSTNPATTNFATGQSIFLGYLAGAYSTSANNSVFLGPSTGRNAPGAAASVFIGLEPGYGATNANYSNFIGAYAGNTAVSSNYSNFIGENAGRQAPNSPYSNFIGSYAGRQAANAPYSNFIGYAAGYLSLKSDNSIFIGLSTGQQSVSASYSILIGSNVGRGSVMGSHNIVMGTNITLANNTTSSLNIGGVLFGNGLYNTTTGNPFSGSANGKIGINQTNPEYTLDVSGSTRLTGNLIVTGSLTASLATGYTWVGNTNGVSVAVPTSSFAGGGGGSISTSGTSLYSTNPATSGFSTNNSIFIGNETGKNANMSYYANFIGYRSGKEAYNAAYSTFIGIEAGVSASSAMSSVFLGYRAGYNAENAAGSNFIGDNTGFNATSASFSNLLGYNIANGSDIGRNNIIIGTNITLDNQRQDSINIGGILFGTGSYFNDGGFPYAGSMPNGKIGINQPLPTSTFEVSGSRAGRIVSYAYDTSGTVDNQEFAIFSSNGDFGEVTGSLPNPSTCPGRIYHIMNTGIANMRVEPGYIPANGGGSPTNILGPKKGAILVSTGANWVSFLPNV